MSRQTPSEVEEEAENKWMGVVFGLTLIFGPFLVSAGFFHYTSDHRQAKLTCERKNQHELLKHVYLENECWVEVFPGFYLTPFDHHHSTVIDPLRKRE
jgi:hypothetical protein